MNLQRDLSRNHHLNDFLTDIKNLFTRDDAKLRKMVQKTSGFIQWLLDTFEYLICHLKKNQFNALLI
jgi:hypothetical protein